MSRPRHYSRLAEAKRQVADVLDDDDSEQFDWMDVEAEDDEPEGEQQP